MTIKQIEELSGMTRANIRFYEQEGLITPLRGGNDYRDYSEDDLTALLKIKLLRQLQVPLDDIRKLQSGELELSAALEDKIRQLELDITDRKNAAEICRDIRANDIKYTELDATKYLNWISAIEPAGSDYFSIRSDAQPRVCHPWRRFFARNLDYAIYSIIWSALTYLAFRWNPGFNPLERFILGLIPYGMMLVIEPILLSSFGTTPGKWIFGLVVRSGDGNKLRFSAAWNRTWLIFVYGEGFSIPIYNLYRNYKSYKTCRDNGELPWDEDIAYTIKDTKIRRSAAFVLANALLLAVSISIMFQAEMPKHRGDLTAEEFTQNFNDLMDYEGLDLDMHLDSNGKWVKEPQDTTIIFEMIAGLPMPDFKITETNGVVTKIAFKISSNTPDIIFDNYTNQINLAIKSYVCAQKDINFISQQTVLSNTNTAFTDFEFTRAGINVKNSVDYGGYLINNNVLFPAENEKQYFYLEFSMEKIA